jgi:hypothetical protein
VAFLQHAHRVICAWSTYLLEWFDFFAGVLANAAVTAASVACRLVVARQEPKLQCASGDSVNLLFVVLDLYPHACA